MALKKPTPNQYAVKVFLVEEGKVVQLESKYHGWYEVKIRHPTTGKLVERWLHPSAGECHASMASRGYYPTTRTKYVHLKKTADDLIIVKGLL